MLTIFPVNQYLSEKKLVFHGLDKDLFAIHVFMCMCVRACMCVSSFYSSLLWLPPNGDLNIAGIHLLCFIMHGDADIGEHCSINKDFFLFFYLLNLTVKHLFITLLSS